MVIIIIPTSIWLGTIVFEKSPTLRFQVNFNARQLSPLKCKITEQNWYMWHTVDVLYINTKFHFDNVGGSWDTETAYFEQILTL